MKAKILFMLLALAFTIMKVNGQSHDNSQGACKLFKNKAIGDGATCPACLAKSKKEQAAKDAENKRRNDVIIAKAEAEQKAREIARKKEQAERDAKNKVTEVFVTMPKSTNVKSTAPEKITESTEMEKNYFYTEKNDINNQEIMSMYHPRDARNQDPTDYFIINNEKKFTNKEFKACVGSTLKHRDRKEFNFPPNVGIVVLNELFTDKNGSNIHISDFIDSKGNRILKDNSISTIIHFADDYFIVFRGEPYKSWGNNYVQFYRNAGDAFIYNLKTNQKHPIPRYTIDGTDLGYEVDYVISLGSNEIDKSKYKARFKSKLRSGVRWAEYICYFITQDGKFEEKIEK